MKEYKRPLRVFYGWTRLNKVRRAESVSVIFENARQDEERTLAAVRRLQDTVYVRPQTPDEMRDGQLQNRMFTEYSIRMDDKKVRGDLEKALEINFETDRFNVPRDVLETIRTELRKHYRQSHSAVS